MRPENIVRCFIPYGLISLFEKGHANNSFYVGISAGYMIGLHTAGGKSVKENGALILGSFKVNIITSELYPVIIADCHPSVHFRNSIQGHIYGYDLIAVHRKRSADYRRHLTAICPYPM